MQVPYGELEILGFFLWWNLCNESVHAKQLAANVSPEKTGVPAASVHAGYKCNLLCICAWGERGEEEGKELC